MLKQSKLEQRAKIINFIYKFELFEQEIDVKEAFESGEFSPEEIKIIEIIQRNYFPLKRTISSFFRESWSWERVSPLEKAILLFGAFELNVHDHALVINELVIITKGYVPGESYKFINGVLQKIGDYYDKIKGNKNNS